MAIDTADKRRSVPMIPGIPGSNIPMAPDGDLDDANDRIHVAGFYRGITPAAPIIHAKPKRGMLLGVINAG